VILSILCYKRFFSPDSNDYNYANAPQFLNLRTLHDRQQYFDRIIVLYMMFLFLERGSKSCPPSMEITGVLVFTRNLPEFLCFTSVHLSKNRPSARCVTAANSVVSDFYVFRKQLIELLNNIAILLRYDVLMN